MSLNIRDRSMKSIPLLINGISRKAFYDFSSSQCPDEEHVECKIDDHANMSVYCIPLTPNFYIVKLGFTGVYIIFSLLL